LKILALTLNSFRLPLPHGGPATHILWEVLGMRNFSIRLTTEQHNQLEALSIKSRDSKAAYIREAIELYLSDPKTAEVEPKLNRRLVEIVEYTAMAMDHIINHRYGDKTRDDILTIVADNLDRFHAWKTPDDRLP
jgi:Ribbon-helix-helix domain